MKIFKITMLMVLVIVIIGCSTKQLPQEPVILYKIKTVYKETTCNVPEVTCDFNANGFDPTVKLLECVILQKHVLDSLRDNNTTR